MARYCMNINPQENGDHEVHVLNDTCSHLPKPENRRQLGEHRSCHEALQKARLYDPKADGCFYCCAVCHTS